MILRTTLQPSLDDLNLAHRDTDLASAAQAGLRRLVILGSSETALAVARDAHHHGLLPVVFDMEDGVALHSRHVVAQRAGQAARNGDPVALVRELRELGHPRHAALIATSDAWLRRVAAVRSQLSDGYSKLMVPSDDTLAVCLDKGRFSQWCREHGVATPLFWRVGAEARPAGLQAPFMIRPATTRHGTANDSIPKAVQARSEAELASWLARYEAAGCAALVSESLLDRPLAQYSVCFARNPHRFLGFVTEKLRPLPRICRSGTFVSIRDEPWLLEIGRAVASQLDYQGIGELEVLYDRSTGRHYCIEMNARPWLQYSMAPASGHDLMQVVSGVAARDYPRGRNQGIHWWSPYADLLHLKHMSPPGVLGLLRTCARAGRALARANVYERLDWSDPRPALPGWLTGRH